MNKRIKKLLVITFAILVCSGCSKNDANTETLERTSDEISTVQVYEDVIEEESSVEIEKESEKESEIESKPIKPGEFEYEEVLGVLENVKESFPVYTKEGLTMGNAGINWYSEFVINGKSEEGWYTVEYDSKILYINSKDIKADIHIFEFTSINEEYYSIDGNIVYTYPNELNRIVDVSDPEDKYTALGVEKDGKWIKVSYNRGTYTFIGYVKAEDITKTEPKTYIDKKIKEYKDKGYAVYEVNTEEEAEKIIQNCIKYDNYFFIGKEGSEAAYIIKDIIQQKYYHLFKDGLCWSISCGEDKNEGISWAEFLISPWSGMENGEKYYTSLGYEVKRVYTDADLDAFIAGLKEDGKYVVYSYTGGWGEDLEAPSMMSRLRDRLSEWNTQNYENNVRATIEWVDAYSENHSSPQHDVHIITVEPY